MAKKKLAPIIMYHNGFDPMNIDVMVNSLKYLRELGYANIYFFEPDSVKIKAQPEDPRMTEMKCQSDRSSAVMVKTAEGLGMKVAIGVDSGRYKESEVISRADPREIEEYRCKRNRIMAQSIVREASEENGDIILVGLSYLNLQTFLTRELEKTTGVLKPLYVLFRSTDSGYAKNWEQISQLAESGTIYNISMLDPEFRKARFPEGIEFFNAPMSKKQEVGKAFQELVADRVKLYEFITEEETSVTKTLTDLLRLKAKVKIAKKFGNSDEYECDAVWDITDCVDSKRYAVCVSISYKLPFVHKKDMGRDYLVIENVNREEVAEKILSKASSRSR